MDANTLEQTLKNQQWVGGQAPTQADVEAFDALKSENIQAATHPHVFAWFCLVYKFTEAVRKTWPAAGGAAKGGKNNKKKEDKPADDDLDLFGEDDDEDAAEVAKKAAAAAKDKKKKKVVIAQSLVLFEVKPLDSETNLDDMAAKILDLTGDGIYWKSEYKKEPVAFGIFKLIIGVTVEDEKVSVDGLQE
jgi:elongation factor 1-beta